MALTTFALGQVATCGYRHNTTDWNAAAAGAGGIALGAGDGLNFLFKGSPKPKVVWADDASTTSGVAIMRSRVKVQEFVEGNFSILVGYRNNAARVIAGIFGTEAVTTLVSGAYSHLFTFSPYMGGVNAQWGLTDNLMLHSVPFLRNEKVTLTWSDNGIGEMTIGAFGKQEITDGTDGANTITTVNASVTVPTANSINYLVLSKAQTTVRMNLFADGELGAANTYATGDKIYPAGISVEMPRAYKRRFTNKNLPFPDEPVGGKWLKGKLKLTIPIEEYASLYRNIVAGTTHKLDITFVGAQIGATGYYDQWKLEIPEFSIDTDGLPDVKTEDLLEVEIGGEFHTAKAAPTGMAFTVPRLTVQDATAGSHLTNGV